LAAVNPLRKGIAQFFIVGLALVFSGCASVSNFQQVGKRKDVPLEYHQKIGLHVHEEVERISYYGSASSDISDMMLFHLQQILPYNTQAALQSIFSSVEISEPGQKIVFKTPELAGYFDIRVSNIRYDYPEAGRPVYRAEVRLNVEFKTISHQLIWSRVLEGVGTSYSDANFSITDFGKGASSALEAAFQDAVDGLEDAVLESAGLREYLRLLAGQTPSQS